jgi:hypothetical protein
VSCTPDTNFQTASKDQMEAFNELQRLSGSPECAARYLETVADLDVRELLSQVRAPRPAASLALRAAGVALPHTVRQLADA